MATRDPNAPRATRRSRRIAWLRDGGRTRRARRPAGARGPASWRWARGRGRGAAGTRARRGRGAGAHVALRHLRRHRAEHDPRHQPVPAQALGRSGCASSCPAEAGPQLAFPLAFGYEAVGVCAASRHPHLATGRPALRQLGPSRVGDPGRRPRRAASCCRAPLTLRDGIYPGQMGPIALNGVLHADGLHQGAPRWSSAPAWSACWSRRWPAPTARGG